MGTIPLPIPWDDFHRGGHPPAFAYGQPQFCFCGRERDDCAPDRKIGDCPGCGVQLKRTGHVAGEPKGRYQCMNFDCPERGWFNRQGERR